MSGDPNKSGPYQTEKLAQEQDAARLRRDLDFADVSLGADERREIDFADAIEGIKTKPPLTVSDPSSLSSPDLGAPDYYSALESRLYSVHGVNSPEKIKFFIELVNDQGKVVEYDLFTNNVHTTIQGMVLYINPNSVSVNLTKMINRTQSMVGWIEEHWGEELDTITFQGSSATFIFSTPAPGSDVGFQSSALQSPEQIREYFNKYEDLPDISKTSEPSPGSPIFTGLTALKRRDTAAYQEFRKLIQIMDGNGATFDSWGFISARVFVQLSYDYASYRGYFESIDITEDAVSPYRFTYTIAFKSEKTIYSFIR